MFIKTKSQEVRDAAAVTKKGPGLKLPQPLTPKRSEASIVMKTNSVIGVDPSLLHAGSRVWVPDAKVLWCVGEVSAIAADGIADVYVPESSDDKNQKVAASTMLGFDPSHLVDHADIAQMNNMHEAPLLSVLHRRYLNDHIYTFTTDILISVNPYKSIPLLYDISSFMASAKSKMDCELKVPHLFSIAEKAHRDMRAVRGTAQSIVVSGESGAGKTEACKHVMKYLAVASRQADEPTKAQAVSPSTLLHEKIEECVLLSNYVLESFGNAKTKRNDNSSRFGKYIQILYNADGRMCGVAMKHFLLEKTRIVVPETEERNYHVFYQMLAGLDATEKAELELSTATDYGYLTYGNCIEIDGVDDAADFRVLRSSMDKLGFTTATQKDIFQILAAILKLGNATFVPSQNDKESCQFAPDVPVQKIAMLLGVNPVELEQKMTTQTTVTGRGSILHMKLTCDQADHAKHAFCKYIYGEVFNYLIGRMNSSSTDSVQAASKSKSYIGILDIFGFEIMPTNSFEQLCINFTNEMLQQQFNKHVFVLEQARYAAEGISVSVIEFQDNQECLDLIQKQPSGLMPLLDEQIMLKRKTTDRQLLTIYHQTHLDKHAHYGKSRFESDDFVVKHYAGDVVYHINGFIAKNNDNLHEDLMDLLRSSSLQLVKSILNGPAPASLSRSKCDSAPTTPSNNHRRQASSISGSTTVASKFKAQLAGLMEMLGSTTPHYIKCIKPNNIKFAGGFSSELVRDQLIYSGILEVIKIRQQGYPIRRPFDQFYETFGIILRKKNPSTSALEGSRQIAAKALLPNAFQIGKTEIYLRYGQLELLQSVLVTAKGEIATIIQSKFWRRVVALRQYTTLKRGMILLQAKWRQVFATSNFQKFMQATLKLQASFRRKCLTTQYKRQQSAAIVLHAIGRGFTTRRRIVQQVKMNAAAIEIQRIARGYLQRTMLVRELKCQQASAVVIQAHFRGYRTLKQFCNIYKSVVLIQATFRAHRNRQRFLKGKAAAVASQALIRKILQRKKFVHQRKMAIRLQALARMIPCRAKFVRTQQSARLLQSVIRGFQARQRYAILKRSMSVVYYAVLMSHYKKAYARQRANAICIQRSIRVFLNRRSYIALMRSVKTIQQHVRKWSRAQQLRTQLYALRSACERRDSDFVVLKLRESSDLIYIRHSENEFNSLLHVAAAMGDLNVVKYIALHDATTLAAVNRQGNTPLHEACLHARLDVAKYLLYHAPVIKSTGPETSTEPATDDAEQSKSHLTTNVDMNGVTVMSGYLKKRRETSGWMARYVVLRNTNQVPELHYFNNKDKVATGKSDRTIDLTKALFKKCDDISFAFEIHSPELLRGRNREGRLYFQAASEMELQAWLACLRDTIPSNLETRLFAMQRGAGSIQFVDRTNQRMWANAINAKGETLLHLSARGRAASDPKEGVKSTLMALEHAPEKQHNQTAHDGVDEGNKLLAKVDVNEVEAIKLTLWLLEHGADINKLSLEKVTGLKLSIQSNYLTLAKHLLDRGATTAELTPLDLSVVQALKTDLTRTAISNAQSQDKEPVLFLLKQPGLVRNSSYVSIYIEQVGLPNAPQFSRPRLVLSVYDTQKNLVEKKQQVTSLPLVQSSSLYWGCTWHMQTPMENLPSGALVVIEVVSQQSSSAALMPSSPRYGATDPICWTYIQIDKRTTDTATLNAEMFKYPIDLKGKKLHRFDGFVSGDIALSHA
ncbi:Aste57867_22874 [Aphanomyces stellatus]|uniref:Aste57867_22874 protein n=1 Tax=Aphanomyces stellatus TaxID=120398 RepID=A0A485LQX5_9STRA|nr:hypothetical protein As57867_022803 [Aphanomyces stellatus]VFT99524.1 Aste57867_22874 [Aphanomyces stellatus]